MTNQGDIVPLTPDQQELIKDWFDTTGVNYKWCAVCNNSSFDQNRWDLLSVPRIAVSGEYMEAENQVPVVVVECLHCGHLQLFAAKRSEILSTVR